MACPYNSFGLELATQTTRAFLDAREGEWS
jgi:hypothetical protein